MDFFIVKLDFSGFFMITIFYKPIPVEKHAGNLTEH